MATGKSSGGPMEFARLDFSGDFICEFHEIAHPLVRKWTMFGGGPQLSEPLQVIDHPRHTSERY
jgi:hypothetical protein